MQGSSRCFDGKKLKSNIEQINRHLFSPDWHRRHKHGTQYWTLTPFVPLEKLHVESTRVLCVSYLQNNRFKVQIKCPPIPLKTVLTLESERVWSGLARWASFATCLTSLALHELSQDYTEKRFRNGFLLYVSTAMWQIIVLAALISSFQVLTGKFEGFVTN